jgi:hypothetical protein
MRFTRNKTILNTLLVVCVAIVSNTNASTLVNMATDDVATTYTYAMGETPGSLSLNDSSLGVLAEFSDDAPLALGNVSLTLVMDFIGELGDIGDDLAHGVFDSGVITLTDDSAEGGGAMIFEATITGFQLMEVVAGSFIGGGTFTNAVYGGALSGVTMPTEGELFSALFDWREDSFDGPLIDIDSFLVPPAGATQVFADMNDLTITPEPTTAMLLVAGAFSLLRRRR